MVQWLVRVRSMCVEHFALEHMFRKGEGIKPLMMIPPSFLMWYTSAVEWVRGMLSNLNFYSHAGEIFQEELTYQIVVLSSMLNCCNAFVHS